MSTSLIVTQELTSGNRYHKGLSELYHSSEDRIVKFNLISVKVCESGELVKYIKYVDTRKQERERVVRVLCPIPLQGREW